jgi:hypothetical protein
MGVQAPQNPTEQQPIEVTPVQVSNDHVGSYLTKQLQRSRAVVRWGDVETAALQSAHQETTLLATSLRDDNARRPAEPRSPDPLSGAGREVTRLPRVTHVPAPSRDNRGCHRPTALVPAG